MTPHLAAAYDLARWLLRHPQDAEDAVQDAFLKAFRAFDGWSGGEARAWILAIVRNTCMTRLHRRRTSGEDRTTALEEDAAAGGGPAALSDPAPLPDEEAVAAEDRRRVHAALWRLPPAYREALVLREFGDLSYREIAEVTGIPAGTVMSRLARAREEMRRLLADPAERTAKDGRGEPEP